jgi:hypothetical protein
MTDPTKQHLSSSMKVALKNLHCYTCGGVIASARQPKPMGVNPPKRCCTQAGLDAGGDQCRPCSPQSARSLGRGSRLRWQIERLFRLWKEHGHIDEWRSKKPWRILCEVYGKLAAMLIQQWLIHEG